jgi:hypothetical protein
MRRYNKSYAVHLALVEELRAQRKFLTNNKGRKSNFLKSAEAYLATLNPFELSDDAPLFE